jgi:eukaryotic-like serine/threonine-protein kinase
MTLARGSKLGPYEILTQIGAGGMGEVWKARDTRLGRIVAIKKVKEQHSERFKQEARTIAALNHPYICQLHDIGPDYLVLEYVEGKPLSNPLPEREAVRLAIQIATALEEAHQKGIIHRDLKPSNIMVTDKGSVKLLDFGLAKLYEQDASSSQLPTADFPATQAGAVLGTVAYMSPEQAQGQPADARSDIFSFGLVLYEMLSGRRAFSGDSTPALMAALLRDEPAQLQASPSLDKIVRRCLAKHPTGRYQTMSELKAALEQVFGETASGTYAEPQPSIVVLPFENLSPDPDNAFFADGLTEELITDLSKVRALRVISRTSAMLFKGARKSLPDIARELKVRYVLEGTVRRAGNNMRITAQLIDASTDTHLWAEKYSGNLDDVFAFQERLSWAIVNALKLQLTAQESVRLMERPIPNLAAYECYLRARIETYRMTPDSLQRALRLTLEGLAIIGENELLYFMLGHVYAEQSVWGLLSHDAAHPLIAECVSKILRLNPHSAKGHALLGMMQYFAGKRIESSRAFQRAIELEPNDPDALLWLISIYVRAGKPNKAKPLIDRLIAIDPLTPINKTWASLCDFIEGGPPGEVVAAARKFMEEDPANHYACWFTLWSLSFADRLHEEAYPIIKRLIREAPESGFGRWATVLKWALDGDREAALKSVTPELLSWTQSDDMASLSLAFCYALLEMQEQALGCLSNVISAGSANYPFIAKNPCLMRIMHGARAEEFLDRLRTLWETQEI